MTLWKRVVPLLLALAMMFCASAAAQTSTTHHTKKQAKKKTSASKKIKAPSARVQHTAQAFVASLDLKAMATQLLQNRSKAAYDGVEKYAIAHPNEAGSLAWFVIGYAHQVDNEYAQSIPALVRAKENVAELDDYVTYFLGKAYSSTADWQNAVTALQDFTTKHPDSLFRRDAAVLYGNALLGAGKNTEAARVFAEQRSPLRADIELSLGRALARAGTPEQGALAFRHVYYGMPLADEADAAGDELQKLQKQFKLAPATLAELKQRADLLSQGRRYGQAADEYKDLISDALPADAAGLKLALAGALWREHRNKDAKDLLERLPLTGDNALNDEQKAQRLYYLGELTRGNDDKAFVTYLTMLRSMEPGGKWLEESLLSTGNSYLLKKDIATAAKFYTELASRVPQGKYGLICPLEGSLDYLSTERPPRSQAAV